MKPNVLSTEDLRQAQLHPEKIVISLSFGLLGAFYEEIMFRGIIQNHVSDLVNNDEKKVILITALIFTVTHLFYLPFTGFGIYYIFVFVMALILSWLRVKNDQVACDRPG